MSNRTRVYGPTAPTRLELMGIRFMAAEAAPDTGAGDPPVDPPELGDAGKRAIAAEREARAAAEREAADLRTQLATANETITTKDAELATSRGETQSLQLERLRETVAAGKNIPTLAAYLTGTTQEELEESATALAAAVSAGQAPTHVIPNIAEIPPAVPESPERGFLRSLGVSKAN